MRSLSAAGAAALFVLVPREGVHAQELAVLESVTVWAQKREADLQDVPQSVTALSADDLSTGGLNDVADVAERVPTLDLQSSATATTTSLRIRRVGALGNIPTFEPAVGLFVDGVFRSRSLLAASDFADVERIEILSGPQNTLYGKNTSAGVVALYTKPPAGRFEGSAEATGGAFDTAGSPSLSQFKVQLGGPLTSALRASIAAVRSGHGDVMSNALAGGPDGNNDDRLALRGQLSWSPSDDLDLRLLRRNESRTRVIMPPDRAFELIVIGGGPAGTSGAGTAAAFGHRVALIEQAPEVGGAGVISGTVPSKTLRETALALSGWRSRKLFGVDLSLRREATIEDFTRHQQQVSAAESQRLASRLQTLAVERYHGTATFVDAHTVRVTHSDCAETLVRGEKILIATGSLPFRPPVFPFEDDRVHDSDELLHLSALPRRLVIVGAGVIGSEYASTFAAMAVDVHVVDGRDALLPFLDAEIASALATAMAASGVKFLWNEQVVSCDVAHSGNVRLTLSNGGTLDCDGVLVCAGRSSNTANLQLAAAGLAPGKRGVINVDAHYRTEVGHIYAAGDVIGAPALAATSMEQARVAMCHAFNISAKADLAPLLPTGIYTIPEVSMVGATQEALQEQRVDFIVGRARYADNPRGRIIGDETGLLKLIFRRDDMRLLGIHVIGEQATEIAHLGLLALLTESDANLFNRACFNYPTLGELYKYATYDALLQRELAGAAPYFDATLHLPKAT